MKKQQFEDHSDEDMPGDPAVSQEAKGSRRGKKKISRRDESDDTADPLEDTHLPVFFKAVYKTPLEWCRGTTPGDHVTLLIEP